MKSKGSKGKQTGKQTGKKPIVNAGPRRELHVPECMVWPDPSAPAPPPQGFTQTDRVMITKPELGKPVDRGYTMPSENTNPNAMCELDKDTAREALRGWPRPQHQEEQHNDFDDFMNGYGVTGGSSGNQYDTYPPPPEPKKKEKKKKGKSGKNDKDPHIADLVSHRFLYEAAMERQRKEQERLRAEEEANRTMRSRRFPKDIKANKTSQLRSIAMAEKVERSATDLWQMPKFKDNAKTALDTRRRGEGGKKKGSKGGSAKGPGEGFPTCTCEEEQTGYHGASTNDRYLQHSPVDYDDNQGAAYRTVTFPDDADVGENGQIVAL